MPGTRGTRHYRSMADSKANISAFDLATKDSHDMSCDTICLSYAGHGSFRRFANAAFGVVSPDVLRTVRLGQYLLYKPHCTPGTFGSGTA